MNLNNPILQIAVNLKAITETDKFKKALGEYDWVMENGEFKSKPLTK